jgi:hypothetical protein
MTAAWHADISHDSPGLIYVAGGLTGKGWAGGVRAVWFAGRWTYGLYLYRVTGIEVTV